MCIADVAVFDGAEQLLHRDVAFADGKVTSVAPAGAAAADCIDGRGKTLLPGLIDLHVHLHLGQPPWQLVLSARDKALRALLYAGVTAALVAQHGPQDYGAKEDIDAGKALGPHLELAGKGLTAAGGHPVPFARALAPWPLSALIARLVPQAEDAAAARAAVQAEVVRRPKFFKIFYDDLPKGSPHLREEVMAAAVVEAKRLGLRPIVHVGTAADMVSAARAGAELLMHTAYRDELSADHVAALVETQVSVVTTYTTFASGRDKALGRVNAFEREVLAADALAAFEQEPRDAEWQNGWLRALAAEGDEIRRRVGRNLLALRSAGVRIYPGTDTGVSGMIPGASLHVELQALRALGFESAELLTAVTSKAARVLGGDEVDYGRLSPGMRADAVLVRGDPLVDIAALAAIEEVFLGGMRLRRISVKD